MIVGGGWRGVSSSVFACFFDFACLVIRAEDFDLFLGGSGGERRK